MFFFLRASLRYWMNWSGKIYTNREPCRRQTENLSNRQWCAIHIPMTIYVLSNSHTVQCISTTIFCETENLRNIWRVHFFHRLALHLLLSNRTVAVLILSCYIDKKCRSKYEIENRLINFHLPYHVLRMCKAFIRDIESNIASIVKFWI